MVEVLQQQYLYLSIVERNPDMNTKRNPHKVKVTYAANPYRENSVWNKIRRKAGLPEQRLTFCVGGYKILLVDEK